MIKFPQPNARENVLLARLELLGTTISVSRDAGLRDTGSREPAGYPASGKNENGEKTAETQ